MKSEKALTRARSINNRRKSLKAHELMDEILELADSDAEDLELLRIKIETRKFVIERLLAKEEPSAVVDVEAEPETSIWERLGNADWKGILPPRPQPEEEQRILQGNSMARRMARELGIQPSQNPSGWGY